MGHHCGSHHLTLDFLNQVREGRIPMSVAFAHLLGHLANVCPRCQEVLEIHEAACPPVRTQTTGSTLLREVSQGLAQAKQELDRLDQESDLTKRIRIAERSRTRMRSRFLVELLLSRVESKILAGDVESAIDDCRLAEAISRRIPDREAGPGGSRDLVVLVRAHLSNALRVSGQLEAAESVLSPLLAYISEMVVPTMEAEVLSLAASLRIVQCRYDEAHGLLQRESAIYRLVEDDHAEGRTLLQIARVHFGRGNLHQAIEVARESLCKLDPNERRDFLCAVHNLAHYLEAAGQVLEAYELLERHVDLYREFPGDALFQGRLTWLHARLLERQGRSSEAEMAFRHTRRHFLCHEMAYSAAIVTLDLAKLLLDQRRFTEVQALAEESADVLATGALHGYAIEAFDLFRQAALAEALSVAELMRIADYLRRAERDPGLRFTGIS
jgi:tetratricopeptide (TPR) repeat protein